MRMRQSVGLVAAVLVSLSQVGETKPVRRAGGQVARVYVKTVRCKYKACWQPKAHGNVHIVYRDGRNLRVTAGGDCVAKGGGDSDAGAGPLVSPDGRTVGWTRGVHKRCTVWSIGGTMFINSDLVLYRDGRVLHVLTVPGTFINGWRFWDGGKQVAIGSRWHHGMGYCRLFDVVSGKLLTRVSSPDAETQHLA